MEYSVIKKNKRPGAHKLIIYKDGPRICEATPWMCWYARSNNTIGDKSNIREQIMQNLYWLLGGDCEIEEWRERIEHWDQGRKVYGVSIDKLTSMFFNQEEKNVALNSFYNV